MHSPIGIFDSGSGGLHILRALREQLPSYDYLYLGDHHNTPYGTKSFEIILAYTQACIKRMGEEGCPLIIIACNTASAKALRTIQQCWIPKQHKVTRVLGIIIPTAEEVIRISQTKHIGILATPATTKSNTFPMEILKLDHHMQVHQEACPIWVDFVEEIGNFSKQEVQKNITHHVQNLVGKSEKIDSLILGCTHYPQLIPFITSCIPPHIAIINQGAVIGQKFRHYLVRHPEIEMHFSTHASLKLLTTGSPIHFEKLTKTFKNTGVRKITI